MSVQTSGSAYRAGLTQLDIITEFNGVKVTTPQELKDELAKYKAGQEVSMTMFRFNRSFSSGEYVTITFKLDAAA